MTVRPYSVGLRRRVLADCDAGRGTAAVAKTFSVSPSWPARPKQHRRLHGGRRGGSPASRRRPKLAEHPRGIRQPVTAAPGPALAELRPRLGVAVALATLWAALRAGAQRSHKPGAPLCGTAPT